MDNLEDILNTINDYKISEENKYDLRYIFERAYYTNMCNKIFNNKECDIITFYEPGVFPNNNVFYLFDINVEYVGENLMDSLISLPKSLLSIEEMNKCYKKYLLDKKDQKRIKKIIKKSNFEY